MESTPTQPAAISSTLPPLISVGDVGPFFELATHRGETMNASELVGKPVVMFCYLSDDSAGCAAEARAFRDLHEAFQSLGAIVVGVGVGNAESHRALAEREQLPFPLLADEQAKLMLALGNLHPESADASQLSIGRTTILFSPNYRAAKVYADVTAVDHPQQVLNDLREMIAADPPRAMVRHAPVLLVPNVLSPAFCQLLIRVWENDGNEDSGFMRQIDGKTVGLLDYNHKIRRDHFLKRDNPITAELKKLIGQRVLPEMRKAFDFEVTRFEDFRIACYDSSRGGYFRPHRDNTTGGTAHRRFAMSLLLSDDYTGGTLRFPEFGLHSYRPEAGSAVVFSCSLLHEATDVTAGRRFVLLSFFYGEKEAKAREQYNRASGGTYQA